MILYIQQKQMILGKYFKKEFKFFKIVDILICITKFV